MVIVETDDFTKTVWERNGFEPYIPDANIVNDGPKTIEAIKVINKGGRPKVNK